LIPSAEDALEVSAKNLIRRIRGGDLLGVARAISLVENGWSGADVFLRLLGSESRQVSVVGFTGPPGAGKSTLISAYIRVLRCLGQRVAVVSVDPSSPTSGGAILGDRLRMHEHQLDPGVFIRSVASRGHLGGLSREIKVIVRILREGTWDEIILETVGTGQSEVEIARIADLSVLVNTPGFGDGVQAIKAGVIEIADVLVVNKSDMPGADRTIRDLESMLKLRPKAHGSVPIIVTNAIDGSGVAALQETIARQLSERRTARS
jgi:LAO/AO transport system kinase